MEDCNLEFNLTIQAKKSAEDLTQKLKKKCFTLALAESCTAGLLSSTLAEIPGASAVLWGSFVCYTKEAKISMLGLGSNDIMLHGLVSRETACAMAESALQKSGAGIAVAITGLAGPDGDGSNTPVGTVWIAATVKGGTITADEYHFTESRNIVRIRAVIAALETIQRVL